jgi:tetratricopeptide (TPR) repeat protein
LTRGKAELILVVTIMRRLSLIAAFFLVFASVYAQQEEPRRGRKPVLIRDDPNEKKPEDQETVIQPNPKLSAQNITVGDFYFKRDNYKAATERYREAVKYNPKSVEAYEKLIRSLEKQKELQEAIAACEQFVATNPSSKEIPKFQERATEIKSKLAH